MGGPKSIRGTSEIKHFLYALIDDYGVDKIREKVVTPLSKFNIAPFYGCHNIRPSELHHKSNGGENPYVPNSLDRLIDALEGNVVDYDHKNKCCGFHVELQANHTSEILAGNAMIDAVDNNADLMVTPCPLCHLKMDTYQDDIWEKFIPGKRIVKKAFPWWLSLLAFKDWVRL